MVTMGAFETVTCCVLALMTFAVFRKELLKVKDLFLSFWIPKKRQKARETKNKRQDSNKENLYPSYSTTLDSTVKVTPFQTVENEAVTKETSLKETSTKITKEEEGLRIKSATLLPDVITFPPLKSFEDFTSQKLTEDSGRKVTEMTTVDPFPLFSDLLQGPPKPPRSPIDSSTSTKTEEIKNDDNKVTKITTETKHEVLGNTETSFIKKEEESVSKSLHTEGVPSITHDVMDLNELINATQKKLESFKNGFRSPTPDSGLSTSTYEVKKTEEILKETQTKETIDSLSLGPLPDLDSIFKDIKVPPEKKEEPKKVAPPVPPKPKLRPLSDPIMSSFNDCLKEMERDLATLNGNLGYSENSTESSCITEDSPFGSTIITKKKKMFSSSSFYEEPQSIYPTVEEQVEMARKIAGSLADDTNKKSKGANMFYKRLKRSSKWIHEGPEPSDESGPDTPEIPGVEPPTPDPSQVPFRPSKGPTKLKLVMDSRPPLDLTALKSFGLQISEHNAVSPDICHDLVKDLQSPRGKGAALFAKRKKKSEEWVVDEEKVKTLLRENERRSNVVPPIQSYNQYSTYSRQDMKLVKSPWEAAMENPYGFCDAAFMRVNPDQLADTVIKAADNKRRNSIPTRSWDTPVPETCMSPPLPMTPAAAQYDIYHAKAPRGWAGVNTVDNASLYSTHPSVSPSLDTQNVQNSYTPLRKMNFQNFNTVPRSWKGASAH
ncbi:WASH complex subunit 2 isoform X2 [Parasteatoda tepidariorum]|uniref:WASH complex subunit 2 isoform X2 n=1 Tax=Parasteatoda tepidariorum TaxID=114398 RepID=UPI0039BD18EB